MNATSDAIVKAMTSPRSDGKWSFTHSWEISRR